MQQCNWAKSEETGGSIAIGQEVKRQDAGIRPLKKGRMPSEKDEKVLEHKLRSHSLDWLFPLSHRSL